MSRRFPSFYDFQERRNPNKVTKPVGLLFDTFNGHYETNTKNFMEGHNMLKSLVMDGGITAKALPLNVLISSRAFSTIFLGN